MMADRFWQQVRRCRHGADCSTCCWPWRTSFREEISIGGIRGTTSYVAYALTYGEVLPCLHVKQGRKRRQRQFYVCHRCHYAACCNPHHLFVASPSDNIRDFHRARMAGHPAYAAHRIAPM